MFVASELAAAAAWDAARAEHLDDEGPFAEAAGTAVALDALASCARLNIQVHGGIGYTWEHDAHLYLRRSAALDAMLGGAYGSRVKLAELAASGRRRAATVELPPEAQGLRSEVRDFRDSYLSTPAGERHRLLVESGYLFPHWPKPWGLAAGPVEQLVIDEELSDVDRAGGLGPNAWILPIMLPTLITHGTGEQKQRWIRPSLSGELVWCQLFSEPDAAATSPRCAPRPARLREAGWSPAARCGRAQPGRRTSALPWSGPIRTRPATPALPAWRSTCTPLGLNSGHCGTWGEARCSTRNSSTRCSSPTRT
jgi:alkylation response protein AidB-like acyl-CoA dehydrogenase